VRWLLAGEGEIGPDYCRSCSAKPNAFTHCKGCECPEILPENEKAIELFIGCDTQWQQYENGYKYALNYVSVKIVAEALGVEWDSDIFSAIKTLEVASIQKRNENIEAQSNSGKA